jgi:hypothetical protein
MKLLIALLIASSTAFSADKVQWNYMQKKWEYAPANAEMKRNYMINKWELVAPDATVNRNYMTNKWEFSRTESEFTHYQGAEHE